MNLLTRFVSQGGYILLAMFLGLSLSSCQLIQPRGDFNQSTLKQSPPQFDIAGKVAVRYLPIGASGSKAAEKPRSDSAFYQWNQSDRALSLQISGALGIGAVQITGDSDQVTLVTQDSTLIAASASELLARATGWQAPIEDLGYWAQGRSVPNSAGNTYDPDGRLSSAQSGLWQAQLSYENSERLPSRIRAEQTGSVNRVTLSINQRK